MSVFHDHVHEIKDNNLENNEVIISGQLLSTLIDETISIDNEAISINGLLIGSRNLRIYQKSADNVEDVYETKHQIHITNFLNFKTSYGIWYKNQPPQTNLLIIIIIIIIIYLGMIIIVLKIFQITILMVILLDY